VIDILGYRDWARQVYETVRVQMTNGDDLHWHDVEPCRPARTIYAVGWSEMIPPSVWREKMVLVVHPSPLPEYRGGSPIQHQIIDGREVSAVSIFKIDEAAPGVDAGPIAWQQAFSLDGTLDEILRRIANTAARGILDTMAAADRGDLVFVPQPPIPTADTRKRRTPEMSHISNDEIRASTARQLYDKIRALQEPYPLPYIVGSDGEKVFITGSRLEE
jgi:methionyl-tRNA formyltransferase